MTRFANQSAGDECGGPQKPNNLYYYLISGKKGYLMQPARHLQQRSPGGLVNKHGAGQDGENNTCDICGQGCGQSVANFSDLYGTKIDCHDIKGGFR